MARKCGIASVIIVGIAFITAVMTRLSLTQKNADIYTREFHFLGVFDSQNVPVPSEEEIDDEINASEIIAVVRPTSEMQVYAYSILQKVEIVEIRKGNETILDEIWISYTNGIYKGNSWALSNLMYSDYEYLVFLNELDGRYYNEFFMGPIRLDAEKTWDVIDLEKEYTYEELKTEKYFATDKATLEMLYEREQYILELLDME